MAPSRRIYGDFSHPSLLPWREKSHELSFRPHTQFSYTNGKGSSDMALVMDAMDLLLGGGGGSGGYNPHHASSSLPPPPPGGAHHALDGFALVSSDSDFTPLVQRLREAGMHVVGFGERKSLMPLVKACQGAAPASPPAS
jgi:hypothetical protein